MRRSASRRRRCASSPAGCARACWQTPSPPHAVSDCSTAPARLNSCGSGVGAGIAVHARARAPRPPPRLLPPRRHPLNPRRPQLLQALPGHQVWEHRRRGGCRGRHRPLAAHPQDHQDLPHLQGNSLSLSPSPDHSLPPHSRAHASALHTLKTATSCIARGCSFTPPSLPAPSPFAFSPVAEAGPL